MLSRQKNRAFSVQILEQQKQINKQLNQLGLCTRACPEFVAEYVLGFHRFHASCICLVLAFLFSNRFYPYIIRWGRIWQKHFLRKIKFTYFIPIPFSRNPYQLKGAGLPFPLTCLNFWKLLAIFLLQVQLEDLRNYDPERQWGNKWFIWTSLFLDQQISLRLSQPHLLWSNLSAACRLWRKIKISQRARLWLGTAFTKKTCGLWACSSFSQTQTIQVSLIV